jgi:hypothetical protein
MYKTVSKPLAHLNFLSGDNCYDIGSMRWKHEVSVFAIPISRTKKNRMKSSSCR